MLQKHAKLARNMAGVLFERLSSIVWNSYHIIFSDGYDGHEFEMLECALEMRVLYHIKNEKKKFINLHILFLLFWKLYTKISAREIA